MKLKSLFETIALVLLGMVTSLCLAEEFINNSCEIASKQLNLITPNDPHVVNSFWQDSADDLESIKRLHVTYDDGSVAIIEHKYCSMYNFEVAYYGRDASQFSDIKNLKKTFSQLVKYSAFYDKKIEQDVDALIETLQKNSKSNKAAQAANDGATSDSKRIEYSLSYIPIEDSSLHQGALFFYMGIGGEH